MKEIMNSDDSNLPDEEFSDYIFSLIEELIIRNEKLDRFKKWLKKYCDEYNIDYDELEIEITDFIELFDIYNKTKSSVIKKLIYKSSKNIYLSNLHIDRLFKQLCISDIILGLQSRYL